MIFLLLAGLLATDPPPAEQLIRAAIAARKAQDDRGWKFTFREDQENYQIDKNGKLLPSNTHTFDNIMLEGENYRKLILIDGKPLDSKTQKKVDQDLEKARAERRGHKMGTITRSVSLADLEHLEKLFDNKVTGSETVLGREAWRVESEPKTGYKPESKQESEALATRRVTWFDKEEGVELKEHIVFLRATNGFQPGSEFDTEYNKFSDAWLVERFTMRIDFKALAVIHAKAETRYRYYDYKRFTVDVKITTQ
jgi:hypothetical protein